MALIKLSLQRSDDQSISSVELGQLAAQPNDWSGADDVVLADVRRMELVCGLRDSRLPSSVDETPLTRRDVEELLIDSEYSVNGDKETVRRLAQTWLQINGFAP
jgi:hypothetical protein